MYPEHFNYPGSEFNQSNLTGFARYGPLKLLQYAGGLLFDTRGFLVHNLPLLLAAAAGWRVLRSGFPGRGELFANCIMLLTHQDQAGLPG